MGSSSTVHIGICGGETFVGTPRYGGKASHSLLRKAVLALYHACVSTSSLCAHHGASALLAKCYTNISGYAHAVCVPGCTATLNEVRAKTVGSRAHTSIVTNIDRPRAKKTGRLHICHINGYPTFGQHLEGF